MATMSEAWSEINLVDNSGIWHNIQFFLLWWLISATHRTTATREIYSWHSALVSQNRMVIFLLELKIPETIYGLSFFNAQVWLIFSFDRHYSNNKASFLNQSLKPKLRKKNTKLFLTPEDLIRMKLFSWYFTRNCLIIQRKDACLISMA